MTVAPMLRKLGWLACGNESESESQKRTCELKIVGSMWSRKMTLEWESSSHDIAEAENGGNFECREM